MDESEGAYVALGLLHEVTKRIHTSRSLHDILDAVAEGVAQAAGFEVTAVNLVMPDGMVEVVSVAGDDEARASLLGMRERAGGIRKILELAEPWGGLWFLGHEVKIDRHIYNYWIPPMETVDDEDAWHPEDTLLALLEAPSGEWLGMLSVDKPVNGRKPDAFQRHMLEIFADHAAIAIMHARAHEELKASRTAFEQAAKHDALTGVGNRFMLGQFDHLHATPDAPVAAIVIDLDAFKAVNDTSGHKAGDEVLQVVAHRIRSCLRADDVIARTGGDEFVVVLQGQAQVEALPDLVARLSETIRTPIIGLTGTHRVGCSLGTAVSAEPISLPDLMSAADAQMYAEKHDHHARALATSAVDNPSAIPETPRAGSIFRT